MILLCETCKTELELNYDPKVDTKDNITELLITPCKKCMKRVRDGAHESGMESYRTQSLAQQRDQVMGL